MKTNLRVTGSLLLVTLLAGCAGGGKMGLPAGLGDLAKGLPGGSGSPSVLGATFDAARGVTEASREIPESEEIALGERALSGVLGAAPLYPNDRIQRYVNQVGRWVASHSERPNLPWRFAVIDTPLVNAGAAPGGQIYISTGLLFRMRSEAELAGALAHEIAHVVQKHHLNAMTSKAATEGAKGIGFALLDSKVKVGGGVLGDTAKKAVLDLTLDGFKTLLLTPLDRSEEEQADRMAMVLAARAGYDPYGVPATIQILQDVSGEQSGLSVLFSTHPNPKDRLTSLDKNFGTSMEKFANQAKLVDRFTTMILGAAPSVAPAPTPAPQRVAPAKAPVPRKK